MASKALAVTALLLTLNLLFFTLVTSTKCPPTNPKTPKSLKNPLSGSTLQLNQLVLLTHISSVFVQTYWVWLIGSPHKTLCCAFLQGLANVEAAVCLCTALKANVLWINLNVPVKKLPYGFQCP